MDEMVDVVDENNRIIYQALKSKAHTEGLLHRTVIAEIIDSKGNFTLVKQSASRQDAGQYVSPVGGHARAGESEIEAIRREAFEEVGLKDFESKRVGQVIFNRKVLGRQENHYFVLYEIYSDDPLRLNEESDSYRLFSRNELKSLLKTQPEIFGAAFFAIIRSFYPDLLT